jgi:ribonuclease H2 subunit A
MPFPFSFTPKPSSSSIDYVVGIDESGRGPVLGPMIYTALYIPTTHQVQLKELGVDDSKQLTMSQREEIFAKVRENKWMGWETRALHAEEIGAQMLAKDKVNLNAMSHDTAVGLVQKIIDLGMNVTEVTAE